jgi:hypothetical protein
MRDKTIQNRFDAPMIRCFAQFHFRIRFLWLFLLWPLAAAAAPGLHFQPVYGPFAENFATDKQQVKAGSPLLSDGRKNPIEQRIEVDSTGVAYRRYASGFPMGVPVSLGLDEYLAIEYGQERRQLWKQRVRREFRSSTVRQLRSGGNRFQWSVPFPESRTLRKIIGEEGPTLSLNGSRTITIGGKSEWTEGEVQTAAGRPSKFPALSMEQESRFVVEGRVGELINIRINQDTQNLGSAFSSNLSDQLANQIKLDYKGDEDAIFQEVQAGNTTLELPATRFVGFRQQNKGLFGIRAKGKLGPMAFTTIASHEKSKSNRKTFKGGAAVDTTQIRDWQYLRNTYFFLDEFYRANLPDYRKVAEGTSIRPEDYINPATLEVYINDFNTTNDAEDLAKEGIARADWDDPRSESGWFEEGNWHRLDPDEEYTLVRELGYIILDRVVQENYALAVIYRTQGGTQYGSRAQEPYEFKLIKPRDARPDFPTWNLEWKNVYRIGSSYSAGRKFDKNSLDIQILKEIPGKEPQTSQEGRSYLQVFGLDLRGNDPNSPADRLIDKDYIGLDDIRGHLIFPDQTPFAPQHPAYKELKETIPDIYTSQQQRDLNEASQYTIQVRSSSTEQRINLGGALGGVRSETVEVRLNSQQLTRGTDYNVDFVGNVTFLGNYAQQVADPGADLEISYETEDIFGLGSQQKTLLGLRTEYEFWSGDGRIGSTLLYNNERTSERRVRVGNEPSRTVIWNLDLKARRQAPLLTRMVDALPLIKTAVPSEITLDAELAQSRPNLNTKGKGYIDDFEGSERPVSLGIGRTRWNPASLPGSPEFDEENRSRMIWYNPYDGVLRTDIWPGQEEELDVQNKSTDVLTLVMSPEEGEYWGGVMSAFRAVNDFSQAKFLEIWVRGAQGVLQIDLGAISEDADGDGNLDTEDDPPLGQSVGDGLVSKKEDVGIDRRRDAAELVYYVLLDSLDGDAQAAEGIVAEFEEEEIDRQAQARRGDFERLYPDRDLEDPEGDNWKYDSQRAKSDYNRINGTEGNKVDLESGDLPDTEDLNNDGVRSSNNDYYHYEIDLANDPHVPDTESDPGRPLGEIWRQFRLPLYGSETDSVGTPDPSRVGYARLLLVSDGEPISVDIALIEVVQNDWQEDDPIVLDDHSSSEPGTDESLNITSIGTDKSLAYKPPPGVKLQRNTQSRTREREQSLVLEYEALEPGHQLSATKILSRTTNYTKYRRLRMYVHGDPDSTEYVRGDSSDLELFFRFGADSTNYYEFISPVYPGWDWERSGWQGNEVDVDLLEISQLKAILQSERTDLTDRPLAYVVLDSDDAPDVEPMSRLMPEELQELRMRGFNPRVALDMEVSDPSRRDGEPAIYRVRGNPSMQQIKQMTIGLRNRSQSEFQYFSGRVFVDELRLDEARNDHALAAYARINTKLADFANLDGNTEWKQENFQTITGGGSNSTYFGGNLNASVQMHQVLPGSWGFSIPVKVQFQNSVNKPRFGPNSDVELTSIEKDSLRTENSKELYDISISRRQGKNWLLRWTIDQMNLRLSHSMQRQSNPTRPLDDQEAQTMSFSYKMPLPRPSLSLFAWMPGFVPQGLRKMELRYLPANLSYSTRANRRQRSSFQAADVDPVTGEIDTTFQENFRLDENYSVKLTPLPGISSDYGLRVDRDLRKKFDPQQLSFGREVGRNQKADINFNMRFIKWLDQNYTFSATYEENSDPANRRAQTIIDSSTGDPIKTRDINTKNDLSARFNLKVPTLLKGIGKPGTGSKKSSSRGRGKRDVDPGERELQREEEKEEEKKEAAKPDQPFFVRRLLHFSGGFLEPVTATWRRNTTARSFNLVERPSLLYQLGIDDSLRVEKRGQGLTQQDAWSRTRSLEMGSGMRFPLGISLKTNYNEKLEHRSGSTQTRLRVRKEQRFPRTTLTWGRADRIPLIKRIVNSAQATISYERSKHSEGEGSLGPRDLLTRGRGREVRISWNGRWRFGPSTNIERVYSSGTDLDFELVSEADSTVGTPPLRGSGSQSRTTTSFKVRHNLKPRSLPLFGKLKSNVDINFEFSLEDEERKNATGDAERTRISGNDKWKTALTLTYNFSQNFRGSGLIRIENNDNLVTEKTRKIREVKLSGTFFLK